MMLKGEPKPDPTDFDHKFEYYCKRNGQPLKGLKDGRFGGMV